jgi:hypothetical protein
LEYYSNIATPWGFLQGTNEKFFFKSAHTIRYVYILFFFSSPFLTAEGAHTVKAEASGMAEMDSAQ